MPEMTGYDTHDRYFASRYWQGGRKVFSIDLAMDNIASALPKPDPDKPTPGNRQVKVAHAESFARYIRDKEDWVAPALILRAPDIFEFELKEDVRGTQFGILSLPRLARNDLRILDGQHRILGVYLAVDQIARELETKRQELAAAKRAGQDPAVIAVLEGEIKKLNGQRDRLAKERLSCLIVIEEDQESFEQMFVDIADNALGITSAIRARFDNRKVVNRALDEALKHALLSGRVDEYQDRVGGDSPYLMGAKHVAEIVRAIAVGAGGRISRRQEDELREADLVEQANDFFDVLVQAFPALEKVSEGTLSTRDLRKTSLLGSTTMLRVLAGAYHVLRSQHDKSDDDIVDYFTQLNVYMDAPVTKRGPWLSTDVFSEGAYAPKARGGDIRRLSDRIAQWAIGGIPEGQVAA